MTLNAHAVIWVGARQMDVTLSPLSVYTKHTLVSHLLRRCYCWDWTIIHCIITFWDTGIQSGPALGMVGLMLELMLVPGIQCYYPLVFSILFKFRPPAPSHLLQLYQREYWGVPQPAQRCNLTAWRRRCQCFTSCIMFIHGFTFQAVKRSTLFTFWLDFVWSGVWCAVKTSFAVCVTNFADGIM